MPQESTKSTLDNRNTERPFTPSKLRFLKRAPLAGLLLILSCASTATNETPTPIPIDRFSIDGMLMDGWVDEVRTMVDRGVPLSAPAMTGIGYRELAGYLAGERTYADAVHATRRATRSLARHQDNWFAAGDERINWLDASDPGGALKAATDLVSSWLDESNTN